MRPLSRLPLAIRSLELLGMPSHARPCLQDILARHHPRVTGFHSHRPVRFGDASLGGRLDQTWPDRRRVFELEMMEMRRLDCGLYVWLFVRSPVSNILLMPFGLMARSLLNRSTCYPVGWTEFFFDFEFCSGIVCIQHVRVVGRPSY